MKYRIGIDLGGTNIKAGIVDENYNILLQKSKPTLVERKAEDILADMANISHELISEYGLNLDDVAGIGIGSPGTVDAERGIVVYSNNFGWNHVALSYFMEKRTGLPIRISNDANCAALGEVKAGAARDALNCILLTLGTGVGGGIIIGGKIFEGSHPGGAEIGHIMLKSGGEGCSCGRKGCLEAYASATALIRDTQRAAISDVKSLIWKYCKGNHKNITGKTAFEAAAENDETAQKVISNYIAYLGDGIVDVINIFRPDKVLLSGGVCNEGETLTVPLNEYVKENCFAGENGFIPRVEIAQLGDKTGIIGAAALIDID